MKRNTVPVTLETEQGPQDYVLTEMSAAARDAYLNTVTNRISIGANGLPLIKKFDGHQGELLTRCLSKKEGTVVTLKEVQDWPTSVVNSLFIEAQKLNHLDQEGKDKTEKKE